MRSLGQLEPVDVILRRVDAWFCDPLELKPDSQLGVPGLVEAARSGAVSIVNPLGSSVLENPALMAFLPRLSEHLLGRPLRAGKRADVVVRRGRRAPARARQHRAPRVATDLARREDGVAVRLGAERRASSMQCRRRIEARPFGWVGQEPLAMASAPTLTPAGLVPRRSVLRAFAVPRNDSYAVMPGGLTRVAPDGGVARISSQAGAISKDTWVLASEPERLTGFWLDSGPAVQRIDPMASIPSRAAENMWWLGRYAERAEAITRLLRVVYDRRNDFQGSANPAGIESLRALLVALTYTTATYPGFVGDGAEQRLESPGRELLDLVVDDQRTGTLAHSVRALLDSAYAVRDQLSADTWLVVGALDREILELHEPMHDPQAVVSSALQRVMQSLLALGGLRNESMVRDLGWRFMDAGLQVGAGRCSCCRCCRPR